MEVNVRLERSFCSNMHSEKQFWYTAGMQIGSEWMWTTRGAVNGTAFTRWRPGKHSFPAFLYVHLGFSAPPSARCLILRHNPSSELEADYYLWDAAQCNASLPYICEHSADFSSIGCVLSDGQGYQGTAQVSKSGKAHAVVNK